MESMYNIPYIHDHLSIEVNSDDCNHLFTPINAGYESELDSLFGIDLLGSDFIYNSNSECTDILELMNYATEPGELDKYMGPVPASNLNLDIDLNLLTNNALPICDAKIRKTEKANKASIFLSKSVGIGQAQMFFTSPKKIEIVNELEKTYRPRYKSDYFAQNGRTRKPRYVTDRLGNHYVTLKIPSGICGQIRVDWVTIPDENKKRYYMPYKFQANNDSVDIPDCNPIKIDIIPDLNSTEIKLYLVLIKAKQDMLKSLQPLQPYQPMKDAIGIADKYSENDLVVLAPKKLIKKYQLGKSQLAFTLCALGSDGHTYVPEWDTTVFSSIIEEENSDIPAEKAVTCPNCSTSIMVDDDVVIIPQITSNKRKNTQMGSGKIKATRKPKDFSAMIYHFT